MKKRLKVLIMALFITTAFFVVGCSKGDDNSKAEGTTITEDKDSKDKASDEEKADDITKEQQSKEDLGEDASLVGETISDVMGNETNTGREPVKQTSEEDKVVKYEINANKYESTLTTKNEILKTSKQLMNKLKNDLTENNHLEKVVFEFYLPIGDNGVDVKVFAFEASRDIISKLDWESLNDDDFKSNVSEYFSDDEFFMFNP